jgi:hypothetical protein
LEYCRAFTPSGLWFPLLTFSIQPGFAGESNDFESPTSTNEKSYSQLLYLARNASLLLFPLQTFKMADTFRDDASRQDKSGFDYKTAGIGFGAMVLIFGTIIGVLVAQNKTLDTSDPATVAPTVVTDGNATTVVGGSATTVDLTCDKMEKDFSTKSIVLTMSVSSSISAVEIEYAANTFEKTYTAMLSNQLEAAQEDYCDPFCRKITAVTVDSNSLMAGEATAQARQASSCDAMLEMTFNVEGTYVGCEDTEFPGLFAAETRRALRKNLRSAVVRSLQDAEEEATACPVCPDDVDSLGLVSPSNQALKNVMMDFVTVLPAICELRKVEIIPANDE